MTSRSRSRGFTLIEVMAAVLLLAVGLTLMLQERNAAIARAVTARNLSIAARLGNQLLHRIAAARVPDLDDGYQGDFADYGEPDFRFVIGLGDGSAFAGGIGTSDEELIWRQAAERQAEEQGDDQDTEEQPEYTRVFLTVLYPTGRAAGDFGEYHLETLLPTWAVYQDFDLWEQLWGGNLAEELQ